ncbi:MAG: cytochrome d ubiquinol oxidase subunit II [Desulforhopalus sp.]
MDIINANLATIWLVLIGFFLLYYTLTDGADLGIGILTLFTRDWDEKNEMMQSIHTIWHANQTWLVILGGMLFGAFPLFFSIVLSALYIPFILMLFGLIFRGVAFEFHANADAKSKRIWLVSFGVGSLMTALGQGFALGGLMGGITVQADSFAGQPTDWMNWYSYIATAGVVCGYLMLGAGYLIARTTGIIHKRSFRIARLSGWMTIVISLAIYIGTSVLHPEMLEKWKEWPPSPIYYFSALALGAFVMYFRSLQRRNDLAPIIWNWLIIIFSFTGLSIGLYPRMIPSIGSAALTVEEVAASPTTLRFMLAVMAILLPIILTYTTYSYWIFRGKTTNQGYAVDE